MDDKPPSFPNYALDYTPSLVYHKPPLLEAVIQKLRTPDLACVAEALERLGLVAHFVNKVSRGSSQWQNEDDMTPLYLVGSATHILLSMPRLNPSNENISPVELLRELTRLAMLILLENLKRAYHFTSNEPYFLEAKFSDLLLTYPNTCGDVLPHLQLWAVTTVATVQPQSASQALYTTRIASLMSLLGIESAKAAFGMVKNIIWIESIAGELNQSLVHAIDGIRPWSKIPP
jgi:hypothetical protein